MWVGLLVFGVCGLIGVNVGWFCWWVSWYMVVIWWWLVLVVSLNRIGNLVERLLLMNCVWV